MRGAAPSARARGTCGAHFPSGQHQEPQIATEPRPALRTGLLCVRFQSLNNVHTAGCDGFVGKWSFFGCSQLRIRSVPLVPGCFHPSQIPRSPQPLRRFLLSQQPRLCHLSAPRGTLGGRGQAELPDPAIPEPRRDEHPPGKGNGEPGVWVF